MRACGKKRPPERERDSTTPPAVEPGPPATGPPTGRPGPPTGTATSCRVWRNSIAIRALLAVSRLVVVALDPIDRRLDGAALATARPREQVIRRRVRLRSGAAVTEVQPGGPSSPPSPLSSAIVSGSDGGNARPSRRIRYDDRGVWVTGRSRTPGPFSGYRVTGADGVPRTGRWDRRPTTRGRRRSLWVVPRTLSEQRPGSRNKT